MDSFLIILAAIPLFLLFLLPKLKKHHHTPPPGPAGLPVIGNLHQLDTTDLPRYLWQLSKQYGPLFSLRLGFKQLVVVSSAQMAQEVLKTKDPVFCSRPALLGQKKLSYNNLDVALSPYNDYWREMRKLCTVHLLSNKRVLSFRPTREEEVCLMIQRVSKLASESKPVNWNETLMTVTSSIICRIGFGKRYEAEGVEMKRFYALLAECQAVFMNFYFTDHFPIIGWVDKLTGIVARLENTFHDLDEYYQELIDEHLNRERRPDGMEEDIIDILLQLKQNKSSPIDLTFDHIKAVLMNLLLGATETSSSTVVWAMTLLIKNPKSLKKVQDEIRNIVGKKGKVEEEDLPKLTYLRAVIKEAMRLHPAVPLLLPRETMEPCVINGYEIPAKTMVYVNSWAVGRDPDCWENPEEFLPERFVDSKYDFKGQDFEYLPFGSGRRGCPGITMGVNTVEVAISNMLYTFDWELPAGMKEDDVDIAPLPGLTFHKKIPLCLVAKVHDFGKIDD